MKRIFWIVLAMALTLLPQIASTASAGAYWEVAH